MVQCKNVQCTVGTEDAVGRFCHASFDFRMCGFRPTLGLALEV